MKVPLSWLRDYVDLTDIGVPQLVERLTLAGLEVGEVRCIGLEPPEGLRAKVGGEGPVWARDKIVVARVVTVEKHPNADRLKLVHVDYGAAEPKVVVTGADNVQVGDAGYHVVLGLTGTVYWDGHATPKKLGELKPTKIRGVPSDSMVMSEFELGISEEHAGVILLHEGAPTPGTPLADFMGDYVLEIDVLPNMARCLSMIGVAREVAALFGRELRLPSTGTKADGPPILGKVRVAIEDPQLCARYAALLLHDATVGPSPEWLRRRLTYAGMRPITNIVDVTNYVMLEWGQPLHAFDYDKLVERAAGGEPVITVRPAREGEVLTTLDKAERKLTPDQLVIADERGAVAVAGVMGGLETEVSAASRNILLEAANFDFVSIRRTARALELPSEASARFSKGVHPETVQAAAVRAAELMRRHGNATVCHGAVDCYPAPRPAQVVELSLAEVSRRLGANFPRAEAVRILRALEFKVEPLDDDRLRVTTPSHRLDIQSGTADLIEELARVHGYDRLPATLLAEQLPEQRTDRSFQNEERVRDLLADCGLQEVITYALTTPDREAPLGLPEAEYVRLLNPISSERTVLRHGLLAGVLEVAAANLRHCPEVRLFEVGAVYLPRPGQPLPEEPRRLTLVLSGRRTAEFWAEGSVTAAPLDFFDLKGVIASLADGLHLPDLSFRPAKPSYLHPGKAAEVLVSSAVVGVFGQLHPKVAQAFGFSGPAVLAGELDLEALLAAVPERFAYTAAPRFPAALRDVAVIVDEAVSATQVDEAIRGAGAGLLRGVRLFDVYRGESIPAGKKSLAYALTYQADDRTLTDKEVDKAHQRIEQELKRQLAASIRGKE